MKEDGKITPDLQAAASGIYVFTAECEGGKAEQRFYLYSPDDQRPPYPTDWWLVQRKTTCAIGEKMDIIVGTSHEDAHVEVRFLGAERTLYRKNFKVNNGVVRIREPFLESYGKQIWVQVSYLKDKTFHYENILVKEERTIPKLDIELKTFRDHLLPGSQETWEVRITSDGKAAQAEVLAMMYDASLDNLRPYSLRFRPSILSRYFPTNVFEQLSANGWHSFFFSPKETANYTSIPDFRFDYLNLYPYPRHAILYSKVQSTIAYTGSSPYDSDMFGDYEGEATLASEQQSRANAAPAPAMMGVALRTNFNETAFFFPQLETDSSGCASFTFTVPERFAASRQSRVGTLRPSKQGDRLFTKRRLQDRSSRQHNA